MDYQCHQHVYRCKVHRGWGDDPAGSFPSAWRERGGERVRANAIPTVFGWQFKQVKKGKSTTAVSQIIIFNEGEKVMKKQFLAAISLPVLLLLLSVVTAQAAEPIPQSSQAARTAAKPAKATTSVIPAEPGNAYPRPSKPAKQYTIGVLIPQLSNPHQVRQAYGYTDEAEKLGVKVILYDAGGYQYLEYKSRKWKT